MIRVRESFGAKLLAALLGTVGLLLVVTFVVVRAQTARQVREVTGRTVQNAGTLFEELTELQRQQAASLTLPFTSGNRAPAMLDAAIASGQVAELAEEADYEMRLGELYDILLAFTDGEGRAVLSMVEGRRITEGDPARVLALARAVLDGSVDEATGYRVVDGRMYRVRTIFIELGFRPIGTVTFGLPIETADLEGIGSVGGFEVCLEVGGACVVRTPGVGPGLEAAMLAAVVTPEATRAEVQGVAYSIQAEPLIPDEEEEGSRVVAVPLDAVVAPFDAIERALAVGGAGALLLSALLGAALSRSLTRPVRDLVTAAGRVAAGDYEVEVRVTSRDEMGTMANAFNDMTRGLLLRERYRSVLSKVVSQEVAAELIKGDVELGGENREVSVVFADIRGFTPLTEGMEPQRVIALLNDCMEHLSRAVDETGGVVDKFIGDEIMAVFGAPVAQADHARRAVCAAVRMRDGISRMNAARAVSGEPPLGVGIGVSTGIAVAGNMGSSDRLNYTVLGETVNLAARLTTQAQGGEILVTAPTLAAAGDGITARSVGERNLKGFSIDVEVFKVDAVTAEAMASARRAGAP